MKGGAQMTQQGPAGGGQGKMKAKAGIKGEALKDGAAARAVK
jgi:hypothetical protein